MTKTFRDNCDKNIVQQTSCEPLFADVQMQLKMYFFVPYVRPWMHQDYSHPPVPDSLKPYISSFTTSPPGCHMPRKAWVQINRLRTGHGRFNANLHRIGLADNKNCVCGDIQSASHILYHCTVMAPPCSITRDGFRERGALSHLSFGDPSICDLFGRLSEKLESMPLACVVPPQ